MRRQFGGSWLIHRRAVSCDARSMYRAPGELNPPCLPRLADRPVRIAASHQRSDSSLMPSPQKCDRWPATGSACPAFRPLCIYSPYRRDAKKGWHHRSNRNRAQPSLTIGTSAGQRRPAGADFQACTPSRRQNVRSFFDTAHSGNREPNVVAR